MAFWGACVASDEPYTLKLDGDHKRLRISQATLEQRKDRLWTRTRSILQCAVGSKPPVSVCSLSKDFPFCQLDLELEESEQVLFTVKGPQLIHLSGYYVPQAISKRAASTTSDYLTIDYRGEENTIMSEKDEERKLTAGEGDIGGIDSFTDGSQDNTGYNDYDLRDGFISENVVLVNADMHEGADEKMVKEEPEFLDAFDSIPESEDEDYVLCIRKGATSGKKMMEKEGEAADKVTVLPNNALKYIDSISKETADGISRLREQESDVGLEKGTEPEMISVELFSKGDASQCNMLSYCIAKTSNNFNTHLANIGEAHKQVLNCGEQENERMEGGEQKIVETDIDYHALEEDKEHQVKAETDHLWQDFATYPHAQISPTNIGKQEKQRIEGFENEKKTIEGDTEYHKDAIKENEAQQAQKESDDLCQGCAANQHGQKSFTNIEIGGSLHSPSMIGMTSCELDWQNSGQKEKKIKERCEGMKTVEASVDLCGNALEENKVKQSQTERDNMCQGCARNQRDPISTKNIEIGDSHPLLPPPEVDDAVNKKSKERRMKDENVEFRPRTTDDGKPRNDDGITFFHGENNCPNGSIPPAEVRCENGQISEKRKKDQVLNQNYVTGGGENIDHASEKEIFNNDVADMGNMVNVLPANIEENIPENNKGICHPHHSLLHPADVGNRNGLKSKKKRKYGDLKQKTGKGNSENLLKEAKFRQNIEGDENIEMVLPANIENRKPMDDAKNHDSYPDLVEDGCQSDKQYKQKKKQKIKAKENGNNLCAIPSKARTLSNGLIIEDLARGESGGKVAAPGRKIKVFYTARLRETGILVESNVGQKKPFKFRLGDKKIIEGWNLGIDGMRTGDRRRLVIPPSLGYGKRVLDVIPPNSWLVYDINLVSLR